LSVLDLPALRSREEALHAAYRSAEPFPHIVIDDFLHRPVANLAMDEFPPPDSEEWRGYVHANERKYSDTNAATWGSTLREILHDLNSTPFLSFLEQLTGIDDLIPDEMLEGGGLHQSVAGGFLNIHADFSVHPRHRNWQRRVNLLLYLNERWLPEWGGDLELWSRDMRHCEARIAPLANRVVVFTTDPQSFHGHPDPMCCPPGVARRSLALYYFTVETAPRVQATRYRSRPGEGARSVVISLDNLALRVYGAAKRRLRVSDRSVGRMLSRLDRLRHRRKRAPRGDDSRLR
jgi:Rps23 Pro-64 3,4-dihydroxylase Tpa1-like proline 4-hydroxylase